MTKVQQVYATRYATRMRSLEKPLTDFSSRGFPSTEKDFYFVKEKLSPNASKTEITDFYVKHIRNFLNENTELIGCYNARVIGATNLYKWLLELDTTRDFFKEYPKLHMTVLCKCVELQNYLNFNCHKEINQDLARYHNQILKEFSKEFPLWVN